MFKSLSAFVAATVVLFSAHFSMAAFPLKPDPSLTPGELCSTPDAYRYQENIPYCNRDVDTKTKNDIIEQYDHDLGFDIQRRPRGDFKIDHYFPLCMGGSNSTRNLWPQHKTVFEQTDALEFEVCEKMAKGRLLQRDAVELIVRAKNDLRTVPEVRRHVQAL
jgi:hypothetical protein